MQPNTSAYDAWNDALDYYDEIDDLAHELRVAADARPGRSLALLLSEIIDDSDYIPKSMSKTDIMIDVLESMVPR